tara:strand:- start:1707 stop:1901 length:195 start_codon:yes stop_codon:yes gene_type:complete
MTFLNELSYPDLSRLRRVVKKVHMKNYPEHLMTSREADVIIEALGPEVAERMVRVAVDRNLFET